MVRLSLVFVLLFALAPRADDSEKWQFAGENNGISFYLKVKRECRDDGSRVSVKLESQLDYAVTVSFRVNDPNWHKTFSRELAPRGVDAKLTFAPEEGGACHPYIDEVFVEPKGTQISRAADED